MNLAYAHQGVQHAVVTELSTADLLTSWAFDPVFLLPLGLALLYFKGYVRYRLRGGSKFPHWRPVLFVLGLTVVALALMSPIDLLADYSFTWHMAQHDLLMLIGLPLVLLGAPFIPVVRGLPMPIRRRLFVPVAKNPLVRALLRFFTHPVVAILFYELNLVSWHVPGIYDAALYTQEWHYLMHGSFMVTGIFFWWHIVTPYPFRSKLNHFLRMGMLAASALVNGALSSMIVFSGEVLYAYQLLPGFWGVTMQDDQVIGSGLMWVMGDMLRLAAVSIIFANYAMRENAKEPLVRASQEREARLARERHAAAQRDSSAA